MYKMFKPWNKFNISNILWLDFFRISPYGFSYYQKCKVKLFSGPKLPVRISRHSMIPLGNGQAIVGGATTSGPNEHNRKIYFLTVLNSTWKVSVLNQALSFPRRSFLAIPIPDTISGCISEGRPIDFFGIIALFFNISQIPKVLNDIINITRNPEIVNC